MVMIREQMMYAWNMIGWGVNSFFVWIKVNDWLSLEDVSEFAGTIVPILALAWWCIKIFQTLKRRRK